MFLKENNIFKCKGRLENAPITKIFLLNLPQTLLSKLIIWYVAQKIETWRH